MTIKERVMRRLTKEEVKPDDELVEELILTVTDRINLLAGTESLPEILNSIAVDAVIKMYRRQYYEGISTEEAEQMSTSFVENVLSEYAAEIQQYRDNISKQKVVRFL